MSDSPTQSGDLGPRPDAEIEPGDPEPGGADSMPAGDEVPVPADLDPKANPAVEEHAPDDVLEEMKKPDDTDGDEGYDSGGGDSDDAAKSAPGVEGAGEPTA